MAQQKQNSKGLKKGRGIEYPLAKRLYDLEEAAHYLGRPVYSVRCLIWKGSLPIVKEDGSKKQYVDVHDMDQFIETNKMVVT